MQQNDIKNIEITEDLDFGPYMSFGPLGKKWQFFRENFFLYSNFFLNYHTIFDSSRPEYVRNLEKN